VILDEIAAAARRRVERNKQVMPLEAIRERALAAAKNSGVGGPRGSGGDVHFERALSGPGLSFICEVKKASPSKGIIAAEFPYLRIAKEYEAAGASAISVLTEPDYFMGRDEYAREIAKAVSIPVLRKDFVVDEYQIYEASLLGARAVLLICALLDAAAVRDYRAIADSLGLSALVEVHSAAEVHSALDAGARIIGINNRDLKTFTVDLGTTGRLRELIPPGIITVSESGIRSAEDIRALKAYAVDAVLIGETLMRAPDKTVYLRELREAAGGRCEN
jgi:indole-3-glycerol phosphate synthase